MTPVPELGQVRQAESSKRPAITSGPFLRCTQRDNAAHSAPRLAVAIPLPYVSSPLTKPCAHSIHPGNGTQPTYGNLTELLFMQKHENKIATIGNSSGKYRHKTHLKSPRCINRFFSLLLIPAIPPISAAASSLGRRQACRDQAPGSVTGRRPQRKIVSKWPRLIHGTHYRRPTQQASTVGSQSGVGVRYLMGPVGIEE